MGKNSEMGLPSDKMKKVVICVDVDGTLRCNCTATCEDPNSRIVSITNTFVSMKNTKVVVWSGGGKAYAQRFVDKFFTPEVAKKILTESKLNYIMRYGQPDIAIDDIS